jgi:lipoate---protein ligase
VAWRIWRLAGSGGELHARDLEEGRALAVLAVDRPALVLGSAQPLTDADAGACRAAGVEVVRRRSGGGAVLLEPGAALWVDLTISRHDPLWDDDVGRAAGWVGRAWEAALDDLGVAGLEVHGGPMAVSAWSRLVCYAGVGPGEVLAGGRKLVGVSQRRTREGARFQCVVHRSWAPGRILDLLSLDAGQQEEALAALQGAGTGLDRETEEVVAALARHLPTGGC